MTTIKRILLTILTFTTYATLHLSLVAETAHTKEKEPVDYVNPYMGNISHMLVPTYPTVHLPNSFLRMTPARGDFTYEYLDGCALLMPSHRSGHVFTIRPFSGLAGQPNDRTRYQYDSEKITPYSYSVFLEKEDVDVSFVPSHQSAIYIFSFEQSQSPSLVFSTRNGLLSYHKEDGSISGYEDLGNGTKAYIYLQANAPVSKVMTVTTESQDTVTGRSITITYTESTKAISARYGISFISAEQAKKNLNREIKNFDSAALMSQGRNAWNNALGKIKVSGGNENDKTVFYTSLYRVYERMVNYSEDGKYYSPFDKKVHEDEGVPFYNDDWIWDTYRAAHPLRILINPKEESLMLKSFIRMAAQSPEGWLPTFPQVTGDAHCMNGNHGIISICDAYYKNLTGIDRATLEKAYEYCRRTVMEETMLPWVRAKACELDEFYKEHGYFPALNHNQTETVSLVHGFEKRQAVAVTLAASYDDFCLAQMAKALGKNDDYEYFMERSFNYRNIFNFKTGFFHPKDNSGNFIEPMDYIFGGGIGAREYYDENNGWTYRWDIAFNIPDLVMLMGGKETFVENLDRTFSEPLGKAKYQFYSQLPDQTGNVGQFSMGNEPSLHIPYLYNYADAAWKTQKRIRSLIEMWFRNDLMGVPGDEDGGGLSAFVVFSAMGFYPVAAGTPEYEIGSPFFESIDLDLGNGKALKIRAKNCSRDNKYIQSVKINGKEWNKTSFDHEDIANGGSIEFVMGNRPNKTWGIQE